MSDWSEYHIVQMGSSSAKAVCPSCAKKAFYITFDNGFGYCFYCGYSDKKNGSEKQKPNIDWSDVYRVYEKFYNACVRPSGKALDFLYNRGVDDSIIDQFDILFCPPFLPVDKDFIKLKLTDKHGRPVLANRIVIPYFYGDSINYYRGRSINDETPKYLGLPQKQDIYPFNWEKSLNLAERKKYIIVTEGEFKAMAASSIGYPTCAFNGVYNMPKGFNPPRDWEIIAAFDNEENNKSLFILKRLFDYFKNLYVLILPRINKIKVDIDDIIFRLGREDLFRQAFDNRIPYQQYLNLVRV
jgi:DNA primase